MRPVVVFRFSQVEGPGYLGEFLTQKGILWDQVNIDAGDSVPEDINGFSGLVLMGGPMSVNDDLPWIPPLLQLIRRAVDRGVPVLGHCLGGQLMSKALGGTVGPNAVKEIGWGGVSKVGLTPAPDWLGELPASFEVFQWHGETFSIPKGAERLLESPFCANQAFLLNDLHLGLQCHIEMTAAMIKAWCEGGAEEIARAADSPAVQQPAAMQQDMAARLERLHGIADILYGKWIQGLRA
ncbi:MAG: type 1 glutamine amidotransferase [Pseudomonadota bacterium]